MLHMYYIFLKVLDFFCFFGFANCDRVYSLVKDIDGIVYIAGNNWISVYNVVNGTKIIEDYANYINVTMKDSRLSVKWETHSWEENIKEEIHAFDSCLGWIENWVGNDSERLQMMRDHGTGYYWKQYFTPTGDWSLMNWTCTGNFIRALLPYDNNTLWVCGTFGSFPKAFLVDKTTLKFVREVDTNFMSCGRYWDEPVAAYKTKTGDIYVGSGWGLYRPDKHKPDVPDNNSTMLYADWRLYKNLFNSPLAMAFVLSSDVNFIDVVKETDEHLFFFGHEVSNQYGLNNQEDRHAWQSFMVRLCKADLGFRYFPSREFQSILHSNSETSYYWLKNPDKIVAPSQNDLGYNPKWYNENAHLPKKHFVSQIKVNFGCYVSRRPRATSDNHYWGETNVVYLNKLADVIFDPERKIKFKTKNINYTYGCDSKSEHSQIPLIGIFNGPGIQNTGVEPTGALCQLQINENIFNEVGSKRQKYHPGDVLKNVNSAYDEIMSFSSMSYSNFYSRTMHRTNGYTPYPYWNQGVFIGDNINRKWYHGKFTNVGKCHENSFYDKMTESKFMDIQNFSNLAWPNELANRVASRLFAVCQFSSAELYGFNATFVVPGVEFKRMFLLKGNITEYVMNKLQNESDESVRRRNSPLMVVLILTTCGKLFRVVLCDMDNGMANHGPDKSKGEWYNWCVFRNSEQPYIYRQYAPAEKRERGELAQYRASSLLKLDRIVTDEERKKYPFFHTVKDVIKMNDHLLIVTATNIHKVALAFNCSSYTTCIDCASDPFCMWDNINKRCERYESEKYQAVNFTQDVLDRGYKCRAQITPTVSATDSLVLTCANADYFRGDIVWKMNDERVNPFDKRFIIDKTRNVLVVLNLSLISCLNFTCVGIRTDLDKLPMGNEYQWMEPLEPSMTLHTFSLNFTPSTRPIPPRTKISRIISIVFNVILILIVICLLMYIMKIRCDKIDQSPKKAPEAIPLTSST